MGGVSVGPAQVETDDAAQARNTRKTRAQRNQEMRRKEEERQREAAKLQRAREHELFRIKSLKRELAEEEQQHEQALAERGKRRAADTRPKVWCGVVRAWAEALHLIPLAPVHDVQRRSKISSRWVHVRSHPVGARA